MLSKELIRKQQSTILVEQRTTKLSALSKRERSLWREKSSFYKFSFQSGFLLVCYRCTTTLQLLVWVVETTMSARCNKLHTQPPKVNLFFGELSSNSILLKSTQRIQTVSDLLTHLRCTMFHLPGPGFTTIEVYHHTVLSSSQ